MSLYLQRDSTVGLTTGKLLKVAGGELMGGCCCDPVPLCDPGDWIGTTFSITNFDLNLAASYTIPTSMGAQDGLAIPELTNIDFDFIGGGSSCRWQSRQAFRLKGFPGSGNPAYFYCPTPADASPSNSTLLVLNPGAGWYIQLRYKLSSGGTNGYLSQVHRKYTGATAAGTYSGVPPTAGWRYDGTLSVS